MLQSYLLPTDELINWSRAIAVKLRLANMSPVGAWMIEFDSVERVLPLKKRTRTRSDPS